MKKVAVVLVVLFAIGLKTAAREKDGSLFYTFVVNSVPDGFNYPLVGFFNLAHGTHTSTHIGFGNWNEEDLTGGQIGFVNITGGNMNGGQVGFINTAADKLRGLQLGFVNAAVDGLKGAQIGFVNAAEETDGAQVSFVNATEALNGIQVGFVNAAETLNGARLGFVNATENLNGVEVGFVNVVEKLNGFQLGFVNVVESVEGGVPFGFLSLVKEGGFRALDLSTSEMFPVNLSYKVGVKPLYTSFVASYSPELTHNLAVGLGVGSILPLTESFYFNPEILTQNKVVSENGFLHSLALNVGYCLTDKLHLSLGPSLVWNHAVNSSDLINENYAIKKWELDDRNTLLIGARIGIRYVFTDF